MTSANLPAVQDAKRDLEIGFGAHGIEIKSLADAFRLGQYVIQAKLAPKGMDSPAQVVICLQAGAELGFSPMQSLKLIPVINGRAGIMGEGALAKIRASGVCSKQPLVGVTGEGDARYGFMRFRRKDHDVDVETCFSVKDAKTARLWGQSGPWTSYPDDMLEWRAVARACKRYFGDVLMGLTVAEELLDYPRVEKDVTPPPRPSAPDPLLLRGGTTSGAVLEGPVSAPSAPEVTPEIDEETGETIPFDLPR